MLTPDEITHAIASFQALAAHYEEAKADDGKVDRTERRELLLEALGAITTLIRDTLD